MNTARLSRVGLAAALLLAVIVSGRRATLAQSPRRELAFASTAASLRSDDARIESMLRTGELDLVGVTPDTLLEGRTHERLAQRYKGLPVIGGAIARQREGDVVRTIFGKVYLDIAMEVTPQLDEATAAARAIEAHGGEAVAVAGEAALAVLPTAGGDYALVWRMTVRTPTDIRTVAVNAVSGGIESDRSRLRDQLPNIGIGTGVGGDRKKVPATRNSQGYQATDQTRPALLSAYDFRGSLSRLNEFLLNGFVLDSDRAIDTDNVWTDGAVVDGHVYVGWTYDFYFKRFGRHGMDDLDGSITTILHPIFRADAGTVDDQTFNLFVDNAEYLGNRQLMLGDGDGTLFDYFAGALDVVAHEYSHGVTEYSSNLDYVDEPGALNESFSDIMGTSTEFQFEPVGTGPRHADWLIGEDITKVAPGYLRSLSDPILGGQPDHYSLLSYIGTDIDSGGIHINSGIPNHAFYLAVNGGTNRVSGIRVPGIGQASIDRIEKIFYRGFTAFLVPTSQFSDARRATLQAASELYGSNSSERAQVELAWTAVGVN